jgi:N-acyl-D-aspartate/D-glutamate deacylase
MQFHILIKGGTVVDGSGAPAYQADVRVSGGRITEIGPGLAPQTGERVIDATGCYVSPGFIECHNHWDGGLWWSPMMEPAPAYGVTTSINGNCGFSMAPARPEIVDDVVDIFNFFEDIPTAPMKSMVPWDWNAWSEYKASFERNVKVPVNFGAFIGHIPLRLYVMGQDAWTRTATADEIAQMCDLLDDALKAGAMGLSTNHLDHDKNERPLPSQLSDDAENQALLDVLGRYPGATLQVIVDHFMRMTGAATVERFARMAEKSGVRMQWAGLPTLKFQEKVLGASQALHEQFKADGKDFWTGFHHVPFTSVVNFGRSLVFAQNGNPVWQEIINAETWEEKSALLADPAWRARARDCWDNDMYAHSYFHDPTALTLRESETGYGPVGITLAEYKEQAGIEHSSDALAQWVLNNGAESVLKKRSWEQNDELVIDLLRDPRSVGNVSDAGAHGKMFCGTGDNVFLLTNYVRDEKKLTIEEGIHVLTGKLADFFGLADRGLIAEGKIADITVFNLDEVERRPEERLYDVPDGQGGRTYRYTRAAAPMRLTLVNGEPTFDNGRASGRFPGAFVGPGPAHTAV